MPSTPLCWLSGQKRCDQICIFSLLHHSVKPAKNNSSTQDDIGNVFCHRLKLQNNWVINLKKLKADQIWLIISNTIWLKDHDKFSDLIAENNNFFTKECCCMDMQLKGWIITYVHITLKSHNGFSIIHFQFENGHARLIHLL